MYGYDGADYLRGQGGPDEIYGGYGGPDELTGDSGNDTITDLQGADTDKVCDGSGNDTIDVRDGDGNDTVYMADDGTTGETVHVNGALGDVVFYQTSCPF